MRLLNVGSFHLVEFVEEEIPPYAILSHRWGNDEVTLQHLNSGQYRGKAGYQKIWYTLEQAKRDGIEWIWVDTCKSTDIVASEGTFIGHKLTDNISQVALIKRQVQSCLRL